MVDDVKAIFADLLDLPPDANFANLRYGDPARWDSLTHMALVGELEDRFDIMIDTDDVIAMSTFALVLQTIQKYGVKLAP